MCILKSMADQEGLIELRPPRTSPRTPSNDRKIVIETLVEAFADDPLYCWLFDESTTRAQALRDNFTVAADAGTTNGCIDSTPQGDAVTIWTRPGSALFDDPTTIHTVLSRWASPTRLEAASRAMTEASRHQPANAAVLHLIAVHPDHAGAGVGSTLIRRRLAELDRIGRTAYLESSNPRNHTFYARHGFMSIADVRLGDDGPSVTCMIRPPSRPAP